MKTGFNEEAGLISHEFGVKAVNERNSLTKQQLEEWKLLACG